MAKVVTGLDIARGAKSKNKWGNVSLMDFSPLHMVPKEEKTQEWIEYFADFYETLGWRQVRDKHKKITKNRKLVAGELDMEDYIINPDGNEYSGAVGIITNQDVSDPLKQFFPIIPNVIQTLTGEGLQKDNRVIVKAVDPFSTNERLDFKDGQFRELLQQKAVLDKQIALIQQGFIPDPNNEQLTQYYEQEMQLAQQASQIENEFKTFRTQAEIFGQHVININRERFKMDVLEKEAFAEVLTNSQICFHLDMRESDFKLELVDNAMLFKHTSPSIRKYSDGDYLGWFQFMSLGDVVNNLAQFEGMNDDIFKKLNDVVGQHASGMLLPDYLKAHQGFYYDTSKPPSQARINYPLAEVETQHNVEHYLGISTKTSSELLSQYTQKEMGDPRLFRVMRLYFRTQRKVGFLTECDRSGAVVFRGWVDETWKETVEPEYDLSINKAKTKNNLLYGQHVDWTQANEWRHVIKISNNMDNSFWKNRSNFEPIYLDGKPCRYQFKSKDDPFDIRPPFEGMDFRTLGTKPISLVDRMKPWQISYNICGNRMNQIMAFDLGKALVVNRQTIPRDYGDESEDTDVIGNYIDNIRNNKIIDISTTKEQLQGGINGAPLTPTVIDLSSIQEAILYQNLGLMIKEEAFQAVGITRQRLGQQKAYETVSNTQSAVQFSETQTLTYFNDFFVEFMPEVYQRMLEATQFYCVTSEKAALDYMNSDESNVYLEIAGKDILHRHLNVYATAKPRVKALEKELKNALLSDNTMGLTMLEKAEGLYAENASEYMQKLRKWDADRKRQEQENFEKEMEARNAQAEANLQNSREQREFDALQKQLDRDSKERVAAIQSMGSEGGAEVLDNLPMVKEAINASLKEQEMNLKAQDSRLNANMKQQEHVDNVLLKQKEIETKLKMKKIDKEIAKENKVQGEK